MTGFALSEPGLIAIGVAVAKFAAGTANPGDAALLPTIDHAALIWGGWSAPNSPVTRLIAIRPLVLIGLLSYASYLWHWPVLTCTRAYSLGVRDVWRDGAIVIVALGLAWLTYTYI